MTDCSVSLKRCATLRAHRMPNVMPVAARLLSRSIEKSFLTVRPSPYARPRSGSGRIQPPAGARRKTAQRYAFLPCIQPNSRSESSRSMSGRSPFATSCLFLRSLRRNTVPHGPVYPDASETKASRMVARSFRMQQSQRMPDPPQRFLTGHFPLSCFLPYRKRLILCVGVFSKPSWFSTTTEMREKRFTLELT